MFWYDDVGIVNRKAYDTTKWIYSNLSKTNGSNFVEIDMAVREICGT